MKIDSPDMNLQIRQLPKGLVALLASVASLPILLLLDVLKQL